MKFLVDSNVFIAIEPFGAREPGHAIAARFFALLHEQGHPLYVHPAVRDDLSRTRDPDRLAHNLAAISKYPLLIEAPIVRSLERAAGTSELGSNDHRDLRLLAAAERASVDFLVTEDVKLKRRAGRAGLDDVVVGLVEAVSMLEALQNRPPDPFPFVDELKTFELDEQQPIFDSLRADYPDFDAWMATKVRPDSDGRLSWVVQDQTGNYRAIALVKRLENPPPAGLTGRVAKLSTYKVDDASSGQKLGELLLKAVLSWAHGAGVDHLFLEVHQHHTSLIGFLRDFGFEPIPHATTPLGELTLAKSLTAPSDTSGLTDLEFHKRFGPPALRPTQTAFVVPVIPRWFDDLFPESVGAELVVQPTLSGLEAEPRPVGSAIKKAYLSNSRTSLVSSGDLLFFYRSRPEAGGAGYVYAVGIVETTLRSSLPIEILDYVGLRTVYQIRDIEEMCKGTSGVLAIMFRQDRLVEPTINLSDLLGAHVLNGPPQSITKVASTEGLEWLIERTLG